QILQRVRIPAGTLYLVLATQPSAEPSLRVSFHRVKGLPERPERKVVSPAHQHSIELGDTLGNVQGEPTPGGQLADRVTEPRYPLAGRPTRQVGPPGPR